LAAEGLAKVLRPALPLFGRRLADRKALVGDDRPGLGARRLGSKAAILVAEVRSERQPLGLQTRETQNSPQHDARQVHLGCPPPAEASLILAFQAGLR